MKQPNPNQGLSACKRRILRNLRSFAHPSTCPVKSDRLVDDNGKPYKLLSYRTEIVRKSPVENLLVSLRKLTLKQLLRRRTQGRHALSRAEANHERAETPAEKGSLWPQVSVCKNYLSSVEAEIGRRGTEAEHLARLADLTPREIKHKLHHGHQAWKRAIRNGTVEEASQLHRRNVTLTTALREKTKATTNQ